MQIIETVLNVLKNKNNEMSRFQLLRLIANRLLPQYRFKWPQLDWWHKKDFNQYLQNFDEINGMNTDRRWMLYQLMRLTDTIPGDTAECGVFKGSSSYLICKTNQRNLHHNRSHFIFDSFEGLSEPLKMDGDYWTKGNLSCGMDEVDKNLSEFKNYSLHKGWIPDRFIDVENRRFSFVHIDVDIYQPTYDSMKFFYPRLNKGGIIICDDYGFSTCPGATKAVNEFLSDKKDKFISLCCGGGFLLKKSATT